MSVEVDLTPTSASEVAKWLLFLASEEPGTTPRSNLDLQKHLYYVQGWALARLGRKAFKESIEAWTYGPVVPDVYAEYAQYGRQEIAAPKEAACKLDKSLRTFVAAIWTDYKRFSPGKLVTMTHAEKPWLEARGDLPEDEPSHNIIRRNSLQAYFLGRMPSPIGIDRLRELGRTRRTG